MSIEDFLKEKTTPITLDQWGNNKTTFTPVVLKKIYGDGLQIIYLWSIDYRPLFWIVRIDSRVNANDLDIEEIESDIEDEFGAVNGDLSENDELYKTTEEIFDLYPMYARSGTIFKSIANFGTPRTSRNA